MQCIHPVRIMLKEGSSDGLLVPCGGCIACRIKKRQEWSLRMLHELHYHEDSSFVTFTYDDEHIPVNNSLRKKDMQNFMKRLRKDISPRKIRYFTCGEYGDQTDRPHYHSILFGMSVKPQDKKIVQDNWPYGFCSFGLAEKDSIRYVAQYIDKKYTGDKAVEEYVEKKREPVFKICSLGIGKQYAEDNQEMIEQMQKITCYGIPQSIPRYYLKRLGIKTTGIKDFAHESELDLIEKLSGERMTFNEFYRHKSVSSIRRLEESITARRTQTERNLTAKISIKQSKL